MSGHTAWSASGHRERAEELAGGREAFVEGAERLLAAARAWRLAEMRQERGYTQAQVAERMGVSKGRVSQIESGQVSGTEVVTRYVEALGGNLMLVAVFADGDLRKVG
ncbi:MULTISPECIES: helix-turn-helix domain-containing protein [Streptomyces]|uniref:DNA-binding protein n=2 Tax=Streptomyces griseoaurantiacus TaxID=68213 RepID=F3NAN2_9ACTN|nr:MULTISPECIES: helix-turn-helix transcriptional regulator [Streptomyces]NJP69325.1 helix-turn-helix transcriptional regulator [Streptomyces sp. C1-2]EGG49341.1 DNA-binding protein [Streptomyces griseoaurantiacus M045]MCF0087390.1 putative antitoxin HigA2 [Streptomyces sp. MH192]MCF0100381.1 putative antitoxin HigA2 [Streptomyces sp. MH191]MDX3362842.1 helix-turn-helix transcriptional regulator [Streptomyces sp. ME02-6978.2a]